MKFHHHLVSIVNYKLADDAKGAGWRLTLPEPVESNAYMQVAKWTASVPVSASRYPHRCSCSTIVWWDMDSDSLNVILGVLFLLQCCSMSASRCAVVNRPQVAQVEYI